jgi:hypothetical protein
VALALAGGGCVAAAAGTALAQCAPKIDAHPSLVVTLKDFDQSGQKDFKTKFSFERTIKRILSTDREDSGNKAEPKRADEERLVDTLLSTFTDKTTIVPHPETRLPTVMDPRQGEAKLTSAKLLDPESGEGLIPVGLFNRLDLVSANTCGEHRIVYALVGKDGQQISRTKRFFLIFEAALKNPDPGQGVEACKAVATFWQQLSLNSDPADRLKKLEEFYYSGLRGFDPVVHVKNFGSEWGGQVRGDIFFGTGKWQLREWLVSTLGDAPKFVIDPVNNNPLAELYAKTFRPQGEIVAPDEVATAKAIGDKELLRFQGAFLRSYIRNLLGMDDKGKVPSDPLSMQNAFSLKSESRYDDFQSTSHDIKNGAREPIEVQTDSPLKFIEGNDEFKKMAEAILNQLQAGLAEDKKITLKHLLHRATSMTCAGCHQTARGLEIGPGKLDFPLPLDADSDPIFGGFVHIDEAGALSPALERSFLPFRAKLLEKALCEVVPPFKRPMETVDFKGLFQAFRKEQSTDRRRKLAGELDQALKLQRARERSEPGLLIYNRRTH